MPQQLKTAENALAQIEDLPELPENEQEFLRLLIQEGKSATEAYRQTHDVSNLSDSQLWNRASRLRGTRRIKEWHQALMASGFHRGTLSMEEHIQDLQGLAQRAESAGNYGAAVNASVNAGKAAGIYVNKYEDVTPTRAQDVIPMLKELVEQLVVYPEFRHWLQDVAREPINGEVVNEGHGHKDAPAIQAESHQAQEG